MYEHRQYARWWLLLAALAAVFLVVSWMLADQPIFAVIFLINTVLITLLSLSMRYLEVADEGHQLLVRFGPVPLFRKRIWYEEIEQFEQGRTTFLDGWGIHLSLRGGWVWNIWGFDCVVLHLKRGTLRIGTDDPDGLVALLETKLPR